ncbi:MAG: adenine-specific methyltransferase EcoRI family protein [Ectothiorhodospiraceae bacterium AqS1]|nr:adenine-specific methyltransferase EcoRI family protein [Ectothiorhodospiraceae bacterium AqS1]
MSYNETYHTPPPRFKSKTANRNLHAAKNAKKDEFYTRRTDVEKELNYYEHHFQGKVVYCNCDDPHISAFFHYFSHKFQQLRLKKLIAACYKNKSPDLFSRHDCEQAVYLEYEGDRNNNKIPDVEEIGVKNFKGDGDFRSPESIELLKQADIVVTNPPFSLFREYVAQLMNYKKKFLILGNLNALKYKEIWPFIKTNRIWLGCNSGSRMYAVPDDYPKNTVIGEDGRKYTQMGNTCWYTNLDHAKRHEELVLFRKYTPEDYPGYDNYDAIEVSKTKNIPMDYKGVMGVPITFLEKYNPDQFEIVGLDRDIMWGDIPEYVRPGWTGDLSSGIIDGKQVYARILIRKREPAPAKNRTRKSRPK